VHITSHAKEFPPFEILRYSLQGADLRTASGFFAVFALEFLTRLEAHGFARWNVDFFTGAGIPADSGLAGLHAKDAKAAELDALAPAQGLLQGFKNRFDGLLGFGAADVCGGHYRVYQVQLNHAILPHL
jgi:hypothetical protein